MGGDEEEMGRRMKDDDLEPGTMVVLTLLFSTFKLANNLSVQSR